MNPIPHHIPPHLAHCVRTHRIATQQEERWKRIGAKARSVQKTRTKEQRAESQKKGERASKYMLQLVRVCWDKPFTISILIEKALLLGIEKDIEDIDRKIYQRRLARMVDQGLLEVVGKSGQENLYQAAKNRRHP